MCLGSKIGVVGMYVVNRKCVKLPATTLFSGDRYRMIKMSVSRGVVGGLGGKVIRVRRPKVDSRVGGTMTGGSCSTDLAPRGTSTFVVAMPAPCVIRGCDYSLDCIVSTYRSVLPCLRGKGAIVVRSAVTPVSASRRVGPVFRGTNFVVKRSLCLTRYPREILPKRVVCRLIRGGHVVNKIATRYTGGTDRMCNRFIRKRLVLARTGATRLSGYVRGAFESIGVTLTGRLTGVYTRVNIGTLSIVRVTGGRPEIGLRSPKPNINKRYLTVSPCFVCTGTPRATGVVGLTESAGGSVPSFMYSGIEGVVGGNGVDILNISCGKGASSSERDPTCRVVTGLDDSCGVLIRSPRVRGPGCMDLRRTMGSDSLVLILYSRGRFGSLSCSLVGGDVRGPVVFSAGGVVGRIPSRVGLCGCKGLCRLGWGLVS